MRILQIRFKNLNSLVGEWQIDLTHPDFATDGIFAITGPTGAGKSTILDALCLALYGRTPRLNKVTKSANEIMSRQCGDCFAEVTFETGSGRYRCHWSQHCAKKKAGAELQAPKHEIADANSGKIIEAKIRAVAEQIEAVTGMNFERFTRSMLLAQGDFAAFLQAAADERAPILEQITGTEIYSRISMRVHERRGEEQKRLDLLHAALAGMALLTAEDEQQLRARLQENIHRETAFRAQIEHHNRAIHWLEAMSRLEGELGQLARQDDEWHARSVAFAADQARLDTANRALELAADFASLSAVRQDRQRQHCALIDCRADLAPRCAAADHAEQRLQLAGNHGAAVKAAQQKELPVIRTVRELDLKIAAYTAPMQAASAAMAQQADAAERLRSHQAQTMELLASHRQSLRQLQQALNASAADEALVEHLAGVRGRFETLKALHGQWQGKSAQTAQADEQLRQAISACQQQAELFEKQNSALVQLGQCRVELQAELVALLENRSLAQWRTSQSELLAHGNLLSKAVDAARSLSNSQQMIVELRHRQQTLEQQGTALADRLASHSVRQLSAEKEVAVLETQLLLLRKIEALEEARQQLQDNHPCPLCGALHHPFAAGNIPLPDATRQQLDTARSELKSVAAALSELHVQQARLNKDHEQAIVEMRQHAEIIAEKSELMDEICARLPGAGPWSPGERCVTEPLGRLQRNNAHHQAQHRTVIEAAEALEQQLASRSAAFEEARELLGKIERDLQTAVHRKNLATQSLERLHSEVDDSSRRRDEVFDQLRREIEPFAIAELSMATLDSVLEQLTARRDQWLDRQKNKITLEQQIATLELRSGHQAEQLQAIHDELAKQQQQRQVLLAEQRALMNERRELFADKKTDAEEARLAAAIDAAESAVNHARNQAATAVQQLSQVKTKIDELEQALASRQQQLDAAQHAFAMRLQDTGFSDEQHYTTACLPENARTQLARQARQLADEKTALGAQQREKISQLELLRQQQLTTEALVDLKNAQTELQDQHKELQHEIGARRQKLRDNESLKQQQQGQLQAIAAQHGEYLRWQQLHELIGSGDGKKYRNFAQGLTFEMMIGHANRQLQKMTDRYLLIRDEGQPLELNVIDNYQAAEVRSTKNLSGGESFIVSLALALGLSQMASNTVRVDSLFLDEGFGTLDEDALDTALETLAGLQQDGKLIGVISHVPALKQRISTRIQVTPVAGGRSRISGPGCQLKT